MRNFDWQLRMSTLRAFRRMALRTSRWELQAFDLARAGIEDTTEQEDSEKLRSLTFAFVSS